MKFDANNKRFFGKAWCRPAKANDNAMRHHDIVHGVDSVVLLALCKAYGWASPLSARDIIKMTGLLSAQVADSLWRLKAAGHARFLWGWWYPRRDVRGRKPVRGHIKRVGGLKVRVCPRTSVSLHHAHDIFNMIDVGLADDI